MKTLKSLLFCACMTQMIFSGCVKDDETTHTGDISAFFKKNKVKSQFFTVNAAQNQTVTGAKGTVLYFPASSFLTASGTRVTSGTVEIELKEVYTIKDMVNSNISTTSQGQTLISGGQIYVSARQNGQKLRIDKSKYAYLSMPASNNSQPMQQFYGTAQIVNGDSTVAWTVADTTTVTYPDTTSGSTVNFVYNFSLDSLTWINCDYFYGSGSPLTQVSAIVPDSFDYSNCAVFILFTTINSVARLYNYDDSTHTFSTGSNYAAPVGINATIIAFAERDSQYYYYSSNVNLTNNHVENVVLTPATEAAIQAALDDL